jgi:peroxiredoxin
MRADIVPGARFPDYELPDHTGRKRKLSELQGDAPMIVSSRAASTVRRTGVRR